MHANPSLDGTLKITPTGGLVESGKSAEEPPRIDDGLAAPHTQTAAARETVSQFMAAVKGNDIDSLTRLANVPFLMGGRVISKIEELRPQFAQMLEKKELLSKLTFEIRNAVPFETIAKEKFGAKWATSSIGISEQATRS